MAINSRYKGLLAALLVSNFVSVLLFALRVTFTQDTRYWFLFWNLLLAWVPALVAWGLAKQLIKHRWSDPVPLILTLVWLTFLPNSFYLMSDLIHLHNTGEIGMLFDAVLFLSCIWNGLVAGMISLFWVHRAVNKRRGKLYGGTAVSIILLLTSFAIYLGRDLRWNTWDILANPAGLIFDVSDRIVHPLSHADAFLTTASFFALLGSMYFVIWHLVNVLQFKPRKAGR
jgi:uncharacterized membrane protein